MTSVNPLLYRPCAIHRISWVLAQLQMIDFQHSAEDGYRELLRLWEIDYEGM